MSARKVRLFVKIRDHQCDAKVASRVNFKEEYKSSPRVGPSVQTARNPNRFTFAFVLNLGKQIGLERRREREREKGGKRNGPSLLLLLLLLLLLVLLPSRMEASEA